MSIIVPVHNAGKYLEQCIDSVLRQTYQKWELFLVDDGSTDESVSICDRYAQLDHRIRVVHKKNTGVSDSRNLGIEMSRGTYLIFLDSDDYWCNNEILRLFVNLLDKYNLDVVSANFYEVNQNGERITYGMNDCASSYASQVIDYLQYLKDIIRRNYFPWLFMIRRDALGALRFNATRIFMEDAELYLRLLVTKEMKCMYVDQDFYAYRKHNNAVTMRYNVLKYRDAFGLTTLCYNLAEETQDKLIRSFLVEEGFKNYLEYVKALSRDSNRTDKMVEDLNIIDISISSKRMSKYFDSKILRIKSYIPYTALNIIYQLEVLIKNMARGLIPKGKFR